MSNMFYDVPMCKESNKTQSRKIMASAFLQRSVDYCSNSNMILNCSMNQKEKIKYCCK